MDSNLKKTIQINPDFLKFPSKASRTRKNREGAAEGEKKEPKPIKIRSSDAKPESEKTIKRRALNYIRKQQEARYKRLANGLGENATTTHRVESNQTYADEFKSDFDDSLAFLQKLADQNAQKAATNMTATLKQYPSIVPPVAPNSLLFNVAAESVSLVEPEAFQEAIPLAGRQASGLLPISSQSVQNNTAAIQAIPRMVIPPPPLYGCLKGGRMPTYRTAKNQFGGTSSAPNPVAQSNGGIVSSSLSSSHTDPPQTAGAGRLSSRLTPEQQRAELKQFLEKRKEEKERVERVKRQRQLLKPHKKQKRTTTRTFRVGKSKHYAHIGVLIPNKTIRNQVLAKKQAIRETPLEEIRKYLIKKGLIRVGSSCPNDVLRKMYESSMLMCGELQNHNADNLLFNYLHNAI